ncbi:MAG: NAD(P)H-dependent oxidoreductase [Elusimicrobia bacterium]|nr:NAD(P)H-dependent oxidoreductase [Elusimicrobiota bacterium]
MFMKHALIVYSHPNPNSFNAAIKNTLETEIKAGGNLVSVRDLYQIGFEPSLKSSDFENFQRGIIPRDIAQEQEFIKQAQWLFFVFPIWWTGLPARMKGYIDKVFIKGFAYDVASEGVSGLLTDKKAVIINTTGTPEQTYWQSGMLKSLEQTISEGIFKFCGVEVVEHKFFCAVPYITPKDRSKMLEEVKTLAKMVK